LHDKGVKFGTHTQGSVLVVVEEEDGDARGGDELASAVNGKWRGSCLEIMTSDAWTGFVARLQPRSELSRFLARSSGGGGTSPLT
jgi:hypothetical protein